MKKLFSLILALAAVVAVNATVVTLSPSDFSAATSAATSATKDGVTAAVTSGTITTDQIRIFKNQTITISCESAISAIVFTCTANDDAQYGPGCFEAQSGYTYAAKYGTWLGNATSVAFKAASNQVRATKIEVYLDGETPSGDAHKAIKATVAEAITAGMALDSMATSEAVYEITGYVVNSQPYNNQYKNQIWFMADDAANAEAQVFEAYACVVKEDGIVKQVIDGDKVVLTGSLTKYYDKNQSKYIIEIKNGTAAFMEKAEGEHEIPEVAVDTITVAEALAIGKALPAAKSNNQKSQEVVVKGFVVKAYPANEGYDDQTWFMADEPGVYGEFEAYQCSRDYEVVDGDYVYVRGYIVNFGDESRSTIEISRGSAVHGEAPKAQRITVAQALEIGGALAAGTKTAERYEVVGYVASILEEYEEGVQSFIMTEDATATTGSFYIGNASIAAPGAVAHDYVGVVGFIENDGQYIQIYNGQATINPAGEGIELINVATPKAQKVLMDGVIYIVRDGKIFNLQGAQVR